MLYIVLSLVIGYFLGSIPFSYLFGKWLGHEDVRKFGSGNVGTTNVMRTFGKKIGVLAFIGDFLKGMSAAGIGWALADLNGAVVAGTAAVFGHCYSIFLHFTGGKGVATSAGAVGGIMPIALALGVPIFALVAWMSGYVSVASLSVYIMALILAWLLHEPVQIIVMILILSCLTFYRHWSNIRRLYSKQEPQIKKCLFKKKVS